MTKCFFFKISRFNNSKSWLIFSSIFFLSCSEIRLIASFEVDDIHHVSEAVSCICFSYRHLTHHKINDLTRSLTLWYSSWLGYLPGLISKTVINIILPLCSWAFQPRVQKVACVCRSRNVRTGLWTCILSGWQWIKQQVWGNSSFCRHACTCSASVTFG